MAQKSLEEVLAQFEKVFAKEIQFDEALFELGIHTAQVRKAYPNLFQALSTGSVSVKGPPIYVDDKTAIQDLLAQLKTSIQNGERIHIPVETETKVQTQVYSEWVKQHKESTIVGDKWRIAWDIPNTPAPALGTSFTLRASSHRVRFTVNNVIDEVTIDIETIAILPLQSE